MRHPSKTSKTRETSVTALPRRERRRHARTAIGLSAALATSSALAEAPKRFAATVGNHSAVVVTLEGDDIIVSRAFDNSTRMDQILNLRSGSLTIMQDHSQPRVVASDALDYGQRLTWLRDMVSYVAGPAIYDRLVFGTADLHPELNEVIAQVDGLIGDSAVSTANCQLFATSSSEEPILALTGGVVMSLDSVAQASNEVWVRQGYELVLSDQKGLATDNANLVLMRGNGLSTHDVTVNTDSPLAGKSGTVFVLDDTPIAGNVQGLICRPSL